MATLTAPLARTPLHAWHSAQGARLVTREGWAVPEAYRSLELELAAGRQGVGLADLSAFTKISLLGKSVPTITSALLGATEAEKPRNVYRLEIGGPVLACRLTFDHLLLLTLETNGKAIEERLSSLGRPSELIQHDATCNYAGYGLVGSSTIAVVQRLTSLNLLGQELPTGSCAETALSGIQALLIRPPDSPLSTLLLYVAWELGQYVWERLLAVGEEYGLKPIGLQAWQKII